LLKRSYHGAKDLYTKEFGHIGGLYSFMTKLRQLINQHKSNKVILFWDGENGGIYRHNIDPAYKANRKDKTWSGKIYMTEAEIRKEKQKEESVLKQKKRIQSYAEELYLRQIECDNVEADDLIAEYCKRYHNDEEIILYTNDRDFAQLLEYNIQIHFDNIPDMLIDRNSFFMKFPYFYKNALTMKIICGDASDNITGVSGVKEKTLLKYFPDLEKRYMSVKEICMGARKINGERKKPLKALQSISEGVERFKINYQLINLNDPFLDDEAIEALDQLEMPLDPEGRSSKILYRMMKEDGFMSQYPSSFSDYVQTFYPVIMNERERFKNYMKKT
jgi:5'-3' exonuclease